MLLAVTLNNPANSFKFIDAGVDFVPCFSGLVSVTTEIYQNYSVYFFISPLPLLSPLPP